MYIKAVQEYFPWAAYVKPTGDGLLLIFELSDEREALLEELRKTLKAAAALINDFPRLTEGDLLINIDCPKQIGIGAARGSATRLVDDAGGIIDYSGRCLNLAARLMDLARPEGLVFSDRHADAVLDGLVLDEDAFSTDQVYLKGVAEEASLAIWRTQKVIVREEAKQPIAYLPSFEPTQRWQISKVRASFVPYQLIKLNRGPRTSGKDIEIHYEYPTLQADGSPGGSLYTGKVKGEHILEPDGHYVRVPFGEIVNKIGTKKVDEKQYLKITPFH